MAADRELFPCHYPVLPDVNFFCDRAHLDAWRSQAGTPVGETLSADEAAELGRQWWGYLNGKA